MSQSLRVLHHGLFDPAVHFSLDHFFRPENHVLDGFGCGATVADNGNTVDAKQRNTAMLLIVKFFHNGTHAAFGDQGNQFVEHTLLGERHELRLEV